MSDYASTSPTLSQRAGLPEYAFGWIFAVVLAAFFLGTLSIINGYPLVFPDTGTYLRQAVRLEGSIDRPPFYSIFLLFLHMRISLWPIPFAQSAIVCVITFRFLALALPKLSILQIFLTIIATGFLSYLPWASNQIMPDIFTPLIVLIVFLLAMHWSQLLRAERIAFPIALAGMISFHQANLPFSLGLLPIVLIVQWTLARGSHSTQPSAIAPARLRRRQLLRTILLIAGPAVMAGMAQASYAYAVIGRLTPSPAAPMFLLARVIYDGPGRAYLDEACPTKAYFLCSHRTELTGNWNYFLWDSRSPLRAMTKSLHERAMLDEASAIVRGTVHAHPAEVASMAARDAVEQFVQFRTVDQYCPCLTGKISLVIEELFKQEFSQYRYSLQNRGEIPWDVINTLHITVVILSTITIIGALICNGRRIGAEAVSAIAVISWSLLLNATIMGALSGVNDRYQARIIWLVPMMALALLLVHRPVIVFRRRILRLHRSLAPSELVK